MELTGIGQVQSLDRRLYAQLMLRDRDLQTGGAYSSRLTWYSLIQPSLKPGLILFQYPVYFSKSLPSDMAYLSSKEINA